MQILLRLRQAKPANTIRSAKQYRPFSRSLFDLLLRAREFAIDDGSGAAVKEGMPIAVVADLVAALCNISRDIWKPADVRAAQKECGGYFVFGQNVEQLRRGFARAVIERQRERASRAVAMIHGWAENAGGASAHGISEEACGGEDSGRSADEAAVWHFVRVPRALSAA